MANFCLIPTEVDKFVGALRDGKINPAELSNLTSEERNNFFKDIVGEHNAKGVNALFESKMLLKNQKFAYTNWAKTVGGLKPEVRRDLITRIERLDRVLDPAEEKDFLKDLASTKLGVDVTSEEAKTIAGLSRDVQESRAALESGGDRLDYGRSKVALANYVNDLKTEANAVPLKEQVTHPIKAVSTIAGVAKSVKASLDNSAIFRQGWKTLWTNPGIWQKNARQTFVDMVREFGKKPVMDEINADIVSRPTYDKMVKAKLAIGTIEEAYPSHLPEKVPLFGRLYKASESAYTGFIYRQRADIFDKYMELAERSGVNTNDKEQLQAIGKLVNALTGRGYMGSLERASDTVNNLFFSPRFLKSNLDTLTAHQLQKDVTPFVRKKAAENLAKVVAGTAAVLGVAAAVKPGSVELDPRSSDFGKIRIGNTRFDVTGGMGSIGTLAARLLTQSSKSSTSGVVKKLNSGFGSQTGVDVLNNFIDNKLSPAAGVIRDLIKQQDFNGKKPTVGGEISNLLVPLPITTYQELKGDPHAANALLSLIADGLGIATNTYGKSTTNWTDSTSKEMTQFKAKLSSDQLKEANNKYNQRFSDWQSKTGQSDRYKALTDEEKQSLMTGEKSKIKGEIFKEYDFKPEKAKKKGSAKELLNSFQ